MRKSAIGIHSFVDTSNKTQFRVLWEALSHAVINGRRVNWSNEEWTNLSNVPNGDNIILEPEISLRSPTVPLRFTTKYDAHFFESIQLHQAVSTRGRKRQKHPSGLACVIAYFPELLFLNHNVPKHRFIWYPTLITAVPLRQSWRKGTATVTTWNDRKTSVLSRDSRSRYRCEDCRRSSPYCY